MVELAGVGSLLNGVTSSSFNITYFYLNIIVFIVETQSFYFSEFIFAIRKRRRKKEKNIYFMLL